MAMRALSAADLAESFSKDSISGVDAREVSQSWLLPAYPDMNSDGVDEYLIGMRSEEGRQWVFVSGKAFKEIKRVDVAAELASNIAKLTSAGDLDGDGAREIACLLPTPAEKDRSQQGVLIFLGATGAHVATLTLTGRQGWLVGKQMALIERYDPNGATAPAVSGRVGEKGCMVAVFDLASVEK